MQRGRIAIRALAVALAMAVALVVRADDNPRQRARTLFKEGEALHQAGDLPGAIERYQKAYQLAPLPLLLFDLAQAHRELGHRQQALELYRQYVAADPAGRGAVEAAQHMSELEASLVAHPEPAPAPAVASPPPPVPASAPGSSPPEAPMPPPRRPLRVPGAALVGGGLVVVATGGVFSALAKIANDAYLHPTSKLYEPSAEHDRATRQSTAIGLYVVGGAVLVTGAALLIVDAMRARRPVERGSR